MKFKKSITVSLAATMLILQLPQSAFAENEYVNTTITVDENSIVGAVDERMLGINDVWNNGIAMSLDSSTQVSDKYVDSIKNSDMPIYFSRMAGNESQIFCWKKALGKFEERGFYSESGKAMNMGLLEWLGYSRSVSPEHKFAFCLNMLEETAEDHADLVRFLCLDPSDENAIGSDGINWAQKRVDLGFSEPMEPEVFELGNELDYADYTNGIYGDKDTDTSTTKVIEKANWYINLCEDSIEAMKSVKPDIKFSAAVFTANGDETGTKAWRKAWNQKVISTLGPQVEYIDYHKYYSKNSGFDFKKVGEEIEEYINNLSGTKPKIYVSEHAVWAGTSEEEGAARLSTTSLEGVTHIGRSIIQLTNRGSVGLMTYHAMSSGVDSVNDWDCGWAVVREFTDGNYYVTGAGELLKTLAPAYQGGNSVKTTVSGSHSYYEKTTFGIDAASADGIMTTTAIKGNDGSMNVVLSNTNPTVGHNITFNGLSGYKLSKEYLLTAADLAADNDPETPDGLYMKTNLINSESSFSSYQLEPKSVVVLKLIPVANTHENKDLQMSVNDGIVSNSGASASGEFSVSVRAYNNRNATYMQRVSLTVCPVGGAFGDSVYVSSKDVSRQVAKFYVEMPDTAIDGDYLVTACTEGGTKEQFVLSYTKDAPKKNISSLAMAENNTEINDYTANAKITFARAFAEGSSYSVKVVSESGTCVFMTQKQKTSAAAEEIAITMPRDAIKGRYTVIAECASGETAQTSFNFNKGDEAVSFTNSFKNQSGNDLTQSNIAEATQVTTNIINKDGAAKDIKVLMAAYDNSGRMIYVSASQTYNIAAGGTQEVTWNTELNQQINCIKLFVLDSATNEAYAHVHYIK